MKKLLFILFSLATSTTASASAARRAEADRLIIRVIQPSI